MAVTDNDPFTLEDIRDALMHLDAHDRDQWVRMAMAVKTEFGETGFEAWDAWSESAGNYDAKAARSTWRSVKAAGANGTVTLGTLVKEAVDKGWKPQQRSPDELKRLQQEQVERRKQREIEQAAEEKRLLWFQQEVSRLCAQVWLQLAEQGTSKYLGQKKVRAFGVRFVKRGMVIVVRQNPDQVYTITGREDIAAFFDGEDKGSEDLSFLYLKPGVLVVPLRDADGLIWNFQLIWSSGKKSFIKFGRKQGLFHLLCDVPPGSPLVLAEGYATAASIHMATDYPTAIAFDSGNMVPVAQTLRAMFTDGRLVIAGDDDSKTKGNPGFTKALAAAKAVGGVAVVPKFAVEPVDA